MPLGGTAVRKGFNLAWALASPVPKNPRNNVAQRTRTMKALANRAGTATGHHSCTDGGVSPPCVLRLSRVPVLVWPT